MKDEKETKKKLLDSAKAEFLEKGYMQASLRSICKNAGVTTGALYFFFEGKEDLFAGLVGDVVEQLFELMKQHYEAEIRDVGLPLHENTETALDISDDVYAAKLVLHYMYQHYDAFILVLTKSQGSRFEHCIDWFVEITEKHYRTLADKMAALRGIPRLEDAMLHWFSHMQMDTFVHIITHVESEDEAMKSIGQIVKYMTSGWFALFQ